jgi:hypothetical protein
VNNIYSPESIALTRRRAAAIRAQVERGELDRSWIETADELDAYAAEREAGPRA